MNRKTNQPPDDALVERVREALAGVAAVEEKRMFGSTAFMVRNKICVAARAERIMCRIDPVLHDELVKRPGCKTVVMRGRQYRGYVHVAAEALATKRALAYWIRLALEYNRATTGTTQSRVKSSTRKAARGKARRRNGAKAGREG